MNIVDTNVLLYAVNRDSAHHESCRSWLEQAVNGDDIIGLPWVVALGFLRISTNRRVHPKPLTAERACDVLDGWLKSNRMQIISARPNHWTILKELLASVGTAGNLTTDAHIAAIAIGHGALLVSCDNDFGRFKILRWKSPLA